MVNKMSSLRKISFLAHSLGGLFAIDMLLQYSTQWKQRMQDKVVHLLFLQPVTNLGFCLRVYRPKTSIYNSINSFQQFGNNCKIDNVIRYICTK